MSDTPDLTEKRPSPLTAFLTAVQFLLISPAFIKRPFSTKELGAAVAFYPLVGLILGGILLSANYLMSSFLSPMLRAALLLALWVILTGALHLDGFLDACDGLLGGYTPESRMEIMRDERVGAFALSGGFLLLLIKFSALVSITASISLPPALLLAPVLSRWGMAAVLAAYPYARSQGLGRAVKDNVGWKEAAVATAITITICILIYLFWSDWRVLLAWGTAALLVWAVAWFTLRRIPGLTGDIYGALNEIIEMAILLLMAAARQL
jgi:adenosylcobinamide-GDP ribazoletransferase